MIFHFARRQKTTNRFLGRHRSKTLVEGFFSLNGNQIASDLALFTKGPSQKCSQVQSGGIALCRNFNRGTRCPFPNSQYLHQYSRPNCWGNHPATSCPNGCARPEQNQFPPPNKTSFNPGYPSRSNLRPGSV